MRNAHNGPSLRHRLTASLPTRTSPRAKQSLLHGEGGPLGRSYVTINSRGLRGAPLGVVDPWIWPPPVVIRLKFENCLELGNEGVPKGRNRWSGSRLDDEMIGGFQPPGMKRFGLEPRFTGDFAAEKWRKSHTRRFENQISSHIIETRDIGLMTNAISGNVRLFYDRLRSCRTLILILLFD